ncbi:MAG: tetratricopeptide repeat protein [Chitinophagales bacterium]|nr:tetratricopeptide repeat protein [Chitinophagales bacterium]
MNKLLKRSCLQLLLTLLMFSIVSTVEAIDRDKSKKKVDKSVEVQVTRLFIDANKAKLIDDTEEAIKLFEEVLQLDKDNAHSKYELARIYFNNGESSRALILAKEAAKDQADNKWYRMLYADLLAYDGQFKQAAEIYEEVIEMYPDEYELHFEWAYFLIRDEQFKEAIEVYNILESKVGLDDNIIYQKQKLYLQLNEIDKAATEIQKLIDANPGTAEYIGVLAEMYEVNGDITKARELYEKILILEPENANALIAIADLSLREGDREKYMANIRKIFKDPSVDIDVKVRVLYTYIQNYEKDSEKIEEAIELGELLVEAHPEDPKSYSIQGDIFYMDDRLEKALLSYRASLGYTKDIFTVWQNILIIESELKMNEQLVETSNEAMELFPLQPLPYLFKGVAYQQLKKYQEAIKPFSKGMKVTVDNLGLKAQFYSNLGDVYHELKNHEASDSCYEESLKLDPNNPYVLNNYAYYLSLRESRLDIAKKMSFQANELDQNNAAFQDTYAWILYKLKEYKEAKEWQKLALENSEEERPVLLEHYGDILFKLGEINEAVKYWQKAMEKGSGSAILGKKIADRKLYEE